MITSLQIFYQIHVTCMTAKELEKSANIWRGGQKIEAYFFGLLCI